MEEKIKYKFTYTEYSENGVDFLRHENLDPEELKQIAAAFFDAGGIRTHEEMKSEKIREIVSEWKTPDGYDKWENDDRVQSYLKKRNQYNIDNGIISERLRPPCPNVSEEDETQ